MHLDDEIIRIVKENADIVKVISTYQPLTKKGQDYLGVCPFHDDSRPSMHVSPKLQLFNCFACGTAGDVFYYVRKRENINYYEAVKKVADLIGFHDPRLEEGTKVSHPVDERKAPLLKCLSDLANYYQYALSTDEGKPGYDYLLSRQLTDEMQVKYKLGYAFNDGAATIKYLQNKGHTLKTIDAIGIASVIAGQYSDKNSGRVIFPICDGDGNVIGFSARTLEKKADAKYINSPETYVFHKSSVLYNYHIAKEWARREGYVYILEGFMDVFALARININSAIALMGTALTEDHINMIRRLGVPVRICLDGDAPGQNATMKASKLLAKAGIEFSIVNNQNSTEDPDEIYVARGGEALKAYLNNLISRVDFAINYFTQTNPLKTSQEKKALIVEFIPILLNVRSSLEFDSYIAKLSKITGYEQESIKKAVISSKNASNNVNKQQTYAKEVEKFSPERKLLRRLNLAEKEMLYQMSNNILAVNFYEENVSGFVNETYRSIASFIVEYASNHENVDVGGVIQLIESSDVEGKDDLLKELGQLQFETNHPPKCDDDLLQGLLKSIIEEKEKIFVNDNLNQSLMGKDALEQARILADYNRRKANKLKK